MRGLNKKSVALIQINLKSVISFPISKIWLDKQRSKVSRQISYIYIMFSSRVTNSVQLILLWNIAYCFLFVKEKLTSHLIFFCLILCCFTQLIYSKFSVIQLLTNDYWSKLSRLNYTARTINGFNIKNDLTGVYTVYLSFFIPTDIQPGEYNSLYFMFLI